MNPLLAALLPNFITSLLDLGKRFIPDPDKQMEFGVELEKLQNELLTKQLEVNVEEAKSESIFVSGWRPFIGWVCGGAFTWAFVLQPIIVFLLTALGHPINHLPILDMNSILPVLLGMLGLAGYRTIEKVQRRK